MLLVMQISENHHIFMHKNFYAQTHAYIWFRNSNSVIQFSGNHHINMEFTRRIMSMIKHECMYNLKKKLIVRTTHYKYEIKNKQRKWCFFHSVPELRAPLPLATLMCIETCKHHIYTLKTQHMNFHIHKKRNRKKKMRKNHFWAGEHHYSFSQQDFVGSLLMIQQCKLIDFLPKAQ
jgi:hypothetical protein